MHGKFYLLINLLLIGVIFSPQLSLASSWQDETVVTGKVIGSDTGDVLPGATVMVKGSTQGAIADLDGNFSISVPDNYVTLVISYIGYVKQEVSLLGRESVEVTLALDVESLEEVVVIGYGSVKKSDATGSVALVSSDDFNKGAVNSPQELILGKAAGVTVTTNSGAPGNSSTIRIRGVSSMSASNDPLIVIDDVPLNNRGTGGAPNILSTLNPNDIESFTILKDASATAIYGSRAAGGVIIITTKRGAEKLKVNYNLTASLYTTPNKLDVYSGDEFRGLISDQYDETHPALGLLGEANTDWQDEIYKNAFGQDHNLSLSGSTDKLKYRVSLGYNNTDGILKTYNFERTTLSVGLDPTLFNDKLKMQINIKGMLNSNNFAEQAAIGNAITFNPTLPVFNGNTRWRGYTTLTSGDVDGDAIVLGPANPVAQLALTDNSSEVMRSIGNIKLNYEILEGLTTTLNLGYDYMTSEGHNNGADSTQWIYIPTPAGGRSSIYENERRNELLDFYLKYNKELESIDSKIDAMVGYSWSHFYNQDSDSTWNLDRTVFQRGTDFPTEHYLVSFFGRLNYSFKGRYVLTMTLRNDLTSRFGPDNRSGLFPSVALAWNVADESFLSTSEVLSDLKLRVGYGVTGQQDVVNDDYPYVPTYTLGNNSARYQLGSTFYNTLRPDGYDAFLQWETTNSFNAGIDFGFGQNRVSGSLDFYIKKSYDLLSSVPISPGTNFTAELLTNVGSMENRGVELNLNWIAVDNDDWNWKINTNVFYNKNELTELNYSDDPDFVVRQGGVGGTTAGTIQAFKVGNSVQSYYVLKQVYGTDGQPINNSFIDSNEDGLINDEDYYIYKNANPDFTIGFNTWLSYKRFDFAINARANLNNYVYNNVAANSVYYNLYDGMGYLRNMSTQADDTQFTVSGEQQRFSDYYIQDASFIKIDNINLAYNLPDAFSGFVKLQLSVGVQNAFVFTKYKGLDPEVNGGLDNNFYPRSRVFLLGLKAEF